MESNAFIVDHPLAYQSDIEIYKEQKYQLMRIEAQLDKEIMRIKHGLRYY